MRRRSSTPNSRSRRKAGKTGKTEKGKAPYRLSRDATAMMRSARSTIGLSIILPL